MNQIYERSITNAVPEVGMGATVVLFSDRQAATVVEVLTEQRIIIKRDQAIRTDKNGMSTVQEYRYAPDPNGEKLMVTKRKNGQWRLSKSNTLVLLGIRDHFYDYSF